MLAPPDARRQYPNVDFGARRAKLRGVLGIIATRLAEAPTVDHVLETTAGLASRAVASRGQAV
jgi:hypothetical protein